MSRLFYLPFENLPQRYTKMWNDSFIAAMSAQDIVVPSTQPDKQEIIKHGEFLDICGTIVHKQGQMQKVAQLFNNGQVKDGDVFFVPDIFYPALESIRYMSELLSIKVYIVAFNHAGRADLDDFVQQLGKWSDTQEQAWHDLCDLVLVGSQYHKDRVVAKFGHKNVQVTGAVWGGEWMDKFTGKYTCPKQDFVIFPHRPCKEKRFKEFLQIARQNPRLNFVITSSGSARIDQELPQNVKYLHSLTKQEYYRVFACADKYLSLAKQETFGYTLQEAIYFGCKVVVPNDACYNEYAHPNSIVDLDVLLKEDALTRIYEQGSLKQSTNINDNAKQIYELCTTLANEWK